MITMDNEAARLLMLQSSQVAGGGPARRLRGLFASVAVKSKGGRRNLPDPSVNLGDHCRRHVVSEAGFPPLFAPLTHLEVAGSLTKPAFHFERQ